MKPKAFVDHLADDKVLAAIAEAERKTSGEIRLYISHRVREDVLRAAQQRFLKLGMARTRHRNAVLLYFAPRTHKFAIWGDVGVHEKCGDEFWQAVVREMTPALKASEFTGGVVHAIRRIGELLARHFPREPGDSNELPDQIVRD